MGELEAVELFRRKQERYAIITDAIFELVNCQLALVSGELEAAERSFDRVVELIERMTSYDVDQDEWSLSENTLQSIVIHERQLIDLMMEMSKGDEQ